MRPPLHALLAALAAGALLLACSAERRYRTLSFFFDGVPDPNAPPPPEVYGPRFDPTQLTAEQRAAMLARRIEPPKITTHRPVAEKRCEACHRIERSDSGPIAFSGVPELNAPPEELCFRCHSFGPARIVHGPVARGLCLSCHLPHQSPHDHLLRQADQKSLCGACHSGETFVTEEAHRAYGDRACSSCHDPHASDREALLRGGREVEGPRDARGDAQGDGGGSPESAESQEARQAQDAAAGGGA